jgi:hypothetical protein
MRTREISNDCFSLVSPETSGNESPYDPDYAISMASGDCFPVLRRSTGRAPLYPRCYVTRIWPAHSDREGGSSGIRRKIWRNSIFFDALDIFMRQIRETRRLAPPKPGIQTFLNVSSPSDVRTIKSPLCLVKNRNNSFMVGRCII